VPIGMVFGLNPIVAVAVVFVSATAVIVSISISNFAVATNAPRIHHLALVEVVDAGTTIGAVIG
jgi:hypothetical protein